MRELIGKEKQGESEAKAMRSFGTFEHVPNNVDAKEAEETNDEVKFAPESRPTGKKEPRKSEFTPGLKIEKDKSPEIWAIPS